mgnify:CR=1
PDGPTKTTNSPLLMDRVKSSTAVTDPKSLRTPSSVTHAISYASPAMKSDTAGRVARQPVQSVSEHPPPRLSDL